jgi:transposase
MMDTGHVENACYSISERNVFIMAKQKRYSKEFKRQAAELVVRQGYSRAEAARRLGVSANSIADWILTLRKSGELDEDQGTQREADHCRDLRKRVRQLEMENEILKKAAAYFAKESM